MTACVNAVVLPKGAPIEREDFGEGGIERKRPSLRQQAAE
jgi:hypothetical protein